MVQNFRNVNYYFELLDSHVSDVFKKVKFNKKIVVFLHWINIKLSTVMDLIWVVVGKEGEPRPI